MADFTTRAILKALNTYLLANMPSLKQAYDDFPNPNQKLTYPCLSVFAKSPVYRPMMPYIVFKGDEILTGPDAGKFPVRKVKGMYDYKLQIDLWADSKPTRASIEKELMTAFNKDPDVSGISLQLTDYFDEWVHFDVDGFNYPDSEAGSQRSEWRTQINVLVNCKDIQESIVNLITETIENNLETPEYIPAPEEEDDSVSII